MRPAPAGNAGAALIRADLLAGMSRVSGGVRAVLGHARPCWPCSRVQGPPARVGPDVAVIEIDAVGAGDASAAQRIATCPGRGGGRDPQLAQRDHDRRERELRLAVRNGSHNLVDARRLLRGGSQRAQGRPFG